MTLLYALGSAFHFAMLTVRSIKVYRLVEARCRGWTHDDVLRHHGEAEVVVHSGADVVHGIEPR